MLDSTERIQTADEFSHICIYFCSPQFVYFVQLVNTCLTAVPFKTINGMVGHASCSQLPAVRRIDTDLMVGVRVISTSEDFLLSTSEIYDFAVYCRIA